MVMRLVWLMMILKGFPLMVLLMDYRKEFLQTVNHLANRLAYPRLVKLTALLKVNRSACLHSANQMVSLMENLTEFLLRANPMVSLMELLKVNQKVCLLRAWLMEYRLD